MQKFLDQHINQATYLNINSPNDNIMQQESVYKHMLTARRDARKTGAKSTAVAS
jgi:hypothetical protein